MELPDIGKNCEHPSCNQLDFLPYQCTCGKCFCSDHYSIHIHECPSMQEHFKVANLDAKSGMWRCSHPDCKDKSLVPLICPKCHQHFCVVHRHVTECIKEDPAIREAAIAKLRAPVTEFNAAKAKVDKQLDESLEAAKRNTTSKKKNDLAIKVQLMRIKNKAVGQSGIPTTDRLYFNVTTPRKCGETTKAVFVAKTWSVGRAIDSIAQLCKVPNENNVATAEKLRLFTDIQDDSNYIADLSQNLNDLLINAKIIDGQSIRLEYVSN